MTATKIFIARHGETEYNRLNRIQGRSIDEPLNKRGRLQAKAIAERMKEEGIDRIYSSSLMRSMETAEIIAWSLRKEYHYFPELDEMDFGWFEGKPVKEVGGELNEIHRKWRGGMTDTPIREGESPAQTLQRVKSRIDGILEEQQGSTLLFILHGRLIRILLSDWMGYGLKDMHRIEHSNGALFHLLHEAEGFRPVYINETGHLKEIADSIS